MALFLPALLLEPQLLGVALAAAFALLLAAEALRLSGLPGVGQRGRLTARTHPAWPAALCLRLQGCRAAPRPSCCAILACCRGAALPGTVA